MSSHHIFKAVFLFGSTCTWLPPAHLHSVLSGSLEEFVALRVSVCSCVCVFGPTLAVALAISRAQPAC